MARKTIKESEAKSTAILGYYEGECADANITNKNGLDITQPVWENVFASDDYKQAIDLGWYIGFLGHPEDPNCMDFEHACIVMTEGHIDPSGKVYGKFNLIDTPVGRIVKSFQDAGVTFGISVRGAGDIVDNSVDPDTFVFRGFDLVSFPAFPESIPTFTSIAASTDLESRKKYQAVCASVRENLDSIDDVTALDTIQSQFAKQSEEYALIEDKKKSLCKDDKCPEDNLEEIYGKKVRCMTDMYLKSSEECERLAHENESLKKELTAEQVKAERKLKVVRRITACQMKDVDDSLRSVEASKSTLIAANRRLKMELSDVESKNLKYNQKMSISASAIADKDEVIARLESKLAETVNNASKSRSRASDLDAEVARLKRKVEASEKIAAEYKTAYAELYGSAIGADLSGIDITACRSIKDIQKVISATSLHSCSVNNSTSHDAYEEVGLVDSDDDNDLVTI